MPGIAEAIRAAEREEPLELQTEFDWLSSTYEPHAAGEVRYVDTGELGWRALVFFGGLGTTARACLLTEFARRTRERLRLRLVSVERGRSRRYDDAVDDVLRVLDTLAIERFCVVGVSGGGPYAASAVARVPKRVISLHLAAAAAGPLIAESGKGRSLLADAVDGRAVWQFPADSAVHLIPGFMDAAEAEGKRSLGALEREWRLLCAHPLPDMGAVRAPAYLYWGTQDEVVPARHVDAWRAVLPNVVALRRYEREGHDVQYRHWDQILLDASGLGPRTLVCRGGRTWLVPGREVAAALAAGGTLGLCCWSGP